MIIEYTHTIKFTDIFQKYPTITFSSDGDSASVLPLMEPNIVFFSVSIPCLGPAREPVCAAKEGLVRYSMPGRSMHQGSTYLLMLAWRLGRQWVYGVWSYRSTLAILRVSVKAKACARPSTSLAVGSCCCDCHL